MEAKWPFAPDHVFSILFRTTREYAMLVGLSRDREARAFSSEVGTGSREEKRVKTKS
jgi:hypothetical protein